MAEKEGQETITDASDWPAPEMREFESKLRCPICQDFFRTTVILRSCSHNCKALPVVIESFISLLFVYSKGVFGC